MLSALAGSPDGVIVAPAMAEGFDLKNDLARFQVIAKVPWPSLGDRVMKRRMELDDNYYAWCTALKLVQSYGRAVRSKEDWAYCYIIDSGFDWFMMKNGKRIPQWFREAMKKYAPTNVRQEEQEVAF